VSTLGPVEEFGPLLRQEAIRRGLAMAVFVVLLIDGAEGLAHMGRLCFPTALQIVDFYHAMEHARKVLQALWAKSIRFRSDGPARQLPGIKSNNSSLLRARNAPAPPEPNRGE
jgi:hypothetical protein